MIDKNNREGRKESPAQALSVSATQTYDATNAASNGTIYRLKQVAKRGGSQDAAHGGAGLALESPVAPGRLRRLCTLRPQRSPRRGGKADAKQILYPYCTHR